MEVQTQAAAVEDSKLEKQQKSGANWFFWIAGLSLVNSIVLHSGGNWNFIVGLGMTQVVDAIGLRLMGDGAGVSTKLIIYALDVVIAGIFVLLGVLSRKRSSAAFVIGMLLYLADGMVFLLIEDFTGMAFHALALFFLFLGFKANREMKKMEEQAVMTGFQQGPALR